MERMKKKVILLQACTKHTNKAPNLGLIRPLSD